MDRTHPVAALVTLIGLTALLYVPLAGAPYVYEDDNWLRVVQRTETRPIVWRVPGRSLTLQTWQWASRLRPDRQHAVNVGVHLVNGLLVYAVGTLIVGTPASLAAAALFLLHPLNSQAVAYVSARADLLMTLGVLLAVLAAQHGQLVLALMGCVVAATSKEYGVIALPMVAWMLAWRRPTIARWQVGVTLMAVVAVGGVGIARGVLLPGVFPSAWAYETFLQWQLICLGRLFALLIIPIGFTLDHDPLGLTRWWALVPLALGGVLLWRRPSRARVAWALGWAGIALAPRLLYPSTEGFAEHHLYLAMVGLSLALAVPLSGLCGPSALQGA